MSDRIKQHYEAYPYPSRITDGTRNVFGPLEELEVLNHYVLGGARDWARPLRVLVAGGGTGDASTALGKQMQARGIPGEVVYIDLSTASREVAEARARHQGLANVRFITGSLLDLPTMGLGEFDYINCSGVLHHLATPGDGVRALESVLAEGGAMGIMVYGELGRTGVYHAQEMLRMLCGSEALPEQVVMAKRLLPALPHSNWLAKNSEHRFTEELDDAEIVDRFLHSCDQAYRVPGCASLMAAGGLRIVEFVPPLLYRPEVFIADPVVLARVQTMERLEQYAFAELVSGVVSKQSFFAVREGDAAVPPLTLDDRSAVPELLPMGGAALADRVKRTGALQLTLGAVTFSQPYVLSPVTERFLRGIDGLTSLEQLCEQALGEEPTPEAYRTFTTRIATIFNLLNRTTGLVLHRGD